MSSKLDSAKCAVYGYRRRFLRLLRTTFAEERGTKDGEVNTAALKVGTASLIKLHDTFILVVFMMWVMLHRGPATALRLEGEL